MKIDLEQRVARLEQQVEDTLEWTQLQKEFAALRSDPTLHQILVVVQRHSNLFRSTSVSTAVSSDKDIHERLDIVLGHADIVLQTASQFSKLPQFTIPPLETSQALANHTNGALKLRQIAEAQDLEIDGLIHKTIELLDNWYTYYVRPMNSAMVDIDRRLRDITRDISRSKQELE